MSEKYKELKDKESYNSYQEHLAFSKELNILRNDFYYQLMDTECDMLIDFLYKPLDILSGDSYSVRKINGNMAFFLLVDGMGKGLSASLTSILMTSFINYTIDKMLKDSKFDLDVLIGDSIDYIKSILLEEEALAIDYIFLNCNENIIKYAKFATPVLLMQNTANKIIKLKSNNPPLSKYQNEFKISECNISNISKFLFYSDGLVENSLKNNTQTYNDIIEKDFLSSFTKKELSESFFEKTDTQEDDVTIIYINRLSKIKQHSYLKKFKTRLEDIDSATLWYEELWKTFSNDNELIESAILVFTELYMNAYEHGNLQISTQTKNRLIGEDIYFETLKKMESEEIFKDRYITVNVSKINYLKSSYIVTQISDEGKGFDTDILKNVFRFKNTFNGRGVFVSRKNSMGIYYNTKGNSILYLHKL